MDIYGQALNDFYNNSLQETLWINTSYGDPEEMPVEVFFRSMDEMPDLEIVALEACRGSVLDIGAGAGSHSLVLQQNKFDVTALELSEAACRLMHERGIKKVIHTNIYNYPSSRYNTLLMLMNGIGLCGTLDGFTEFLTLAKTLLKPDGQLLFDSSDISYLYRDAPKKPSGYFGEIKFQYSYKGNHGDWFKWLYIDQKTLYTIAGQQGWLVELLFEDDYDQYLVRLSPKTDSKF